MLKLHQFAPAWGINSSHFCLKLETYLRMASIPYEVVFESDLRKAPKGKLPFIEDQGTVLADSNFIIEYLKATYGDNLDQNLTSYESAIKVALQRLLDENLYWVVVYSRWQVPENWEKTKEAYFRDLPPILKPIISNIARKQTLQNLKGHGMGKHTSDEIYRIGITDLKAVSDFLGDKRFLMGEQPTSLDATAYGLLVNLLWAPIESPLKAFGTSLTNLEPYCQRIKSRFYA